MLLGHSALVGMVHTEVGIIVLLECSCGERIAQLTGRIATEAAEARGPVVPDDASTLDPARIAC
jgi:hypothetical protein